MFPFHSYSGKLLISHFLEKHGTFTHCWSLFVLRSLLEPSSALGFLIFDLGSNAIRKQKHVEALDFLIIFLLVTLRDYSCLVCMWQPSVFSLREESVIRSSTHIGQAFWAGPTVLWAEGGSMWNPASTLYQSLLIFGEMQACRRLPRTGSSGKCASRTRRVESHSQILTCSRFSIWVLPCSPFISLWLQVQIERHVYSLEVKCSTRGVVYQLVVVGCKWQTDKKWSRPFGFMYLRDEYINVLWQWPHRNI